MEPLEPEPSGDTTPATPPRGDTEPRGEGKVIPQKQGPHTTFICILL